MKKHKYKIIFFVIATVTLVLIWPKAKLEISIDKCLDSGGRWNSVKSQCEYK